MRPGRLLFLLVAGALLSALPDLAPPAEAVDLKAAEEDLDALNKFIKSRKSNNDDIRQYLDAVFGHLKTLQPPPKPEGDDPAALEQWGKECKAFDSEREKFKDKVEKAVLKTLTIAKPENETNLRDDVNIRAAQVLGEWADLLKPEVAAKPDEPPEEAAKRLEKEREALAKKIRGKIEKELTKVKTHRVNTELLDATFAALGKLNDHDSLEWMNKNYTHTKDNEREYLVAAHKAMVLFTDVPGKLRFEIVDQMIKSYAGVELQAEQVSNDPKLQAKKRFWDEIKTYTIPAVQYFAGKPTDDTGAALAEMKQFEDWWRDHKNPRKEPWVDRVPE